MSERPLPEDVSQWPHDPWQLLGVEHGVDPRDARRAYNRLLRFYKPDHFPEEFRRLREAFDTVQQHAAWEYVERSIEAENEATPAEEQPAPAPLVQHISVRLLEDELLEAWQMACSGNRVAAYAQLERTHLVHPQTPEPFLRLYWLLRLEPQLDTSRQGPYWLLRGLRATAGRDWSLRELWRRAVDRQPQLALDPEADALLEVDRMGDHVAEFAGLKWEALARLGRWNQIESDLELFRAPLAGKIGKCWRQLMVHAYNQLVWIDSDAAMTAATRLLSEIEQSADIDGADFDELTRFDYARSVADGLHRQMFLGTITAELVEIIIESWVRPAVDLRSRLLNYLRRPVRYPRGLLDVFTRLQANASSVLAQFGILLTHLENAQETELVWTDEAASARIGQFLDSEVWSEYSQLRPALLDFCTNEFISPQHVAQELDARKPAHVFTPLAEQIATDWPLHYVCQSIRLFWA